MRPRVSFGPMRRKEALLLVVLALGVLGVLAVLLRGAVAVVAVVATLLVLVALRIVLWRIRLRAWRNYTPDAPAAQAGRLHLSSRGASTWEPPASPPRYPTAGDLVRHRWWDPDGAPRHYAHVAIEVPDAAVGRPLHRATRRALRAASRALPGRGRVRASAAVKDKEGPASLVRVRIEVQGVGAQPQWAEAAARAFAESLREEVGG